MDGAAVGRGAIMAGGATGVDGEGTEEIVEGEAVEGGDGVERMAVIRNRWDTMRRHAEPRGSGCRTRVQKMCGEQDAAHEAIRAQTIQEKMSLRAAAA